MKEQRQIVDNSVNLELFTVLGLGDAVIPMGKYNCASVEIAEREWTESFNYALARIVAVSDGQVLKELSPHRG